MGEQQGDDRRRMYSRLSRTTSYALECVANDDAEGEKIALKHAIELMLDLLGKYYYEGGDRADAVELDGVRGMQGEVQDIPQAGEAQEEGAREAHVVPVVHEGDEAQGEVLSGFSPCCLYCRTSHVEAHEDAVHVRIDNAGIGRDAARSFVAQGRYASFGYVPTAVQREWSRLRGEGFSKEIERRDRMVEIFQTGPSDDHITRRGELAKWLRRLAKPTAVLAADDAVAQEVLQACTSARLSVPGEVAVIGIDDDELVCENATPRLSSIRPDFIQAGKAAADSLETMMRGRATKPSSTVVIHGENEIVRRASTPAETTSGPLVQKALAFIEKNAKRGIGVKDVQEHLKVSRSLMDLRFREVRGESVLSVILSARLAELKRLLRETNDSIESITRRLGWTSPNYPKNLFKKRFGMSMSRWRNQ